MFCISVLRKERERERGSRDKADEWWKAGDKIMYSTKASKGLSTFRWHRSNDGMDSVATSYFTDGNDVPLARVLARRERFGRIASSLTWSHHESGTEAGVSTRSLGEVEFVHEMLETGRPRETWVRCSQMFKGRIMGTMGVEGEGKELGRGVEDVRLRQEHVDGGVIRMPALMGEEKGGQEGGEAGNGLEVVREAMLAELRDLYTIVGSMETRRFDIGMGDVRGLFGWFGMFERFVRVYFAVSERWVYEETGIDEWGAVEGCVGGERGRKKEKRKIVGLMNKVWGMKRVLEAAEGGEVLRHGLGRVRSRVDGMTMCLVRYMKAEAEVGRALQERGMMAGVTRGLATEMRKVEEGGRESVVVMSRGLERGGGEMARWVGQVLGGRGGRRWLWRVVDGHVAFVREFEKAHAEYVALYRALCALVDEQMHAINPA